MPCGRARTDDAVRSPVLPEDPPKLERWSSVVLGGSEAAAQPLYTRPAGVLLSLTALPYHAGQRTVVQQGTCTHGQ